MQFLISTYNDLRLFDAQSGQTKILDKDRGKYYGISWIDDKLFATVGVRLNKGEKYGEKTERILVFDRHLKLIGDLLARDEGLNNVHQLQVKGPHLWIANTGLNAIDLFDFRDRAYRRWYPLNDYRDADINHFNSLYFGEDEVIYIVAHNNDNPSLILRYQYPEMKFLDYIQLGAQAHNAFVQNGEVFVCDSKGSGNLIGHKGSVAEMEDGYPRGLAVCENYFWVGLSPKAARESRGAGDCYLYQINRRDMREEARFTIKGAGNIYDVRILDGPDFAHGAAPFQLHAAALED